MLACPAGRKLCAGRYGPPFSAYSDTRKRWYGNGIREKKQIGLAFLLTALAGCLLHGLYALWPNAFTALVSPIWESLWEHLKILVWPYLAAALVLT